MQPDVTLSNASNRSAQQAAGAQIWRIARKELTLFFSSPVAWLFLGVFTLVTLFAFFWGEAFFARNIADVRPIFEWMPILLVFLSAALTMRLWSDERRNGTIEHVLTQSVPLWQFVVGKFLACWVLLALALLLTLPLPISVGLMGELDWGPVVAGYLATLLLGAVYIALGLAVSSRTDNPIVSLLLSCALGGALYLAGSSTLTSLATEQVADVMRSIGTGARFESIARGVLDLGDLYYYLGLAVVFLCLNVYFLEQQRWATASRSRQAGHARWRVFTVLAVVNLLVANIWLGQLDRVRLDVTQGGQYSISAATRSYLGRLQEPLLLRGYFSERTHPLLAPLVPRLKDLMKEYAIASHGKVRVEFVDPQQSQDLAEEAAEKYDIKPVPFQVADRYQSSIVSSYFDVLVEYGDEHVVLNFRDLIDVQARSEKDIQVNLKNPEYDLTRAIRQTLNAWQSKGKLFDNLTGDLTLNAYVSDASRMPKELRDFRQQADQAISDLQKQANGHLQVNWIDPDSKDQAFRDQIASQYGFQKVPTGLFSDKGFYFNLLISQGGRNVTVPVETTDVAELQKSLEASIKRFAAGGTKTLALVAPVIDPQMAQYDPSLASAPQYNQLRQLLAADYNVEDEDLSDGHVSADADVLMLMSPENLPAAAVRAVDQFLMQGGTVILATSPFQARVVDQSLVMTKHSSGLEAWLKHNGLDIQSTLVMDPHNAAFPIPVTRNIGGFQMQQLVMLDYPYFPDLRGDQLNQQSLITSGLPQVTVPWASPIKVTESEQRQVTTLLSSSKDSWVSDSLSITPKLQGNSVVPYRPQGELSAQLMGVVSEGQFDSFFADNKPADTAAQQSATAAVKDSNAAKAKQPNLLQDQLLSKSLPGARIVLFASSDLDRDMVLRLGRSASQEDYLNPLQMLMNTVDWSLQDRDLLTIRSRSEFNRTLPPMTEQQQIFWEYLNYGSALVLLLVLWGVVSLSRRRREARYGQLVAAAA
ncbi:Gldg family protein [Oceanobacter mangrovi]|uniref:Gldg family protein n=1 Tax=Oceanobacter mangrovi TaxID=2862510 RepID=UPI001C8DD387|nr:Gldg family protein [Oceanobacter mangrovi]